MNTTKQSDRDQTLRSYKTFYGQLAPPSAESLLGTHKGEIIGRKMQRALGRPSLAFMQLGGWWGKQFDTPEQGINIVQKRGRFRPKLPMLLEERRSLIDGKPSLVVVYPPASPFLWPWIVDELRRIDDNTCLGMTVFTPLKLVTTVFALDSVDNNPI